MYAICLSDITNTPVGDDWGIQFLIKPVFTDRVIDAVPRRFDGVAIVLDCDDERGAAIHQLIRQKYEKYQLRLFYSKTGNGGWKTI